MEPQSSPPPASPFNPAPRAAVPQGGGGCSKPVVVGCIAVFLVGAFVVLGGIYYVGTHADALLQWTLQTMETNLLAQLPKDVTPEEKANLQQAFAGVRQGLQQGTIPRERLQSVQFKIMELARKGSGVTRQDIVDFTRALQEVVGKPGGAGGTSPPAAAPTASPTP
jgi:hypothetical protein